MEVNVSESSTPFRVLASEETDQADATADVRRVEELVTSAPVVLLMKGSPTAPQCGFSANTVSILRSIGARFNAFDVLSDPGLRTAAKTYAQWPTFPQLWVRGELVGGNDIVTEMHDTGELQELLSGVV
jgi:monothiol glutaredoxin